MQDPYPSRLMIFAKAGVATVIKSVIYTTGKHLRTIWAGLSTQWQGSFLKYLYYGRLFTLE